MPGLITSIINSYKSSSNLRIYAIIFHCKMKNRAWRNWEIYWDSTSKGLSKLRVNRSNRAQSCVLHHCPRPMLIFKSNHMWSSPVQYTFMTILWHRCYLKPLFCRWGNWQAQSAHELPFLKDSVFPWVLPELMSYLLYPFCASPQLKFLPITLNWGSHNTLPKAEFLSFILLKSCIKNQLYSKQCFSNPNIRTSR